MWQSDASASTALGPFPAALPDSDRSRRRRLGWEIALVLLISVGQSSGNGEANSTGRSRYQRHFPRKINFHGLLLVMIEVQTHKRSSSAL